MIDMDGTLLDTMPHWQRVERAVFARLGARLPADAERRLCLLDAPQEVMALTGLDREALWHLYAEGMDEPYAEAVAPKPGAEAFLQALAGKGIAAWLVTASHARHAEAGLRRCGMLDAFERVVSTKETAHKKHAPAFFPWLAEATGVRPDALDICQAAKGVGCSALGVLDPIHRTAEAMRQVCDATGEDFGPLTAWVMGA